LGKLIRSEDDLKDPRLDLVHASPTELPQVTLIDVQIDPLRSDRSKVNDALKKAGVSVKRREYEGVTHAFFGAAAGGRESS
jgi:acetyl esterase/lipase